MKTMKWTHQLLHLMVEPPGRPLRRLTLYYLVLGSVSLAVRELAVIPSLVARWAGLGLIMAMIIALGLMLPVVWVYLATRDRRTVDRSVVQTMLVLPLVVAGVIVVVHNSLPLAFSLAGIVAAVRFRNTLKDTADMLFVFLAISVGLTVGAGAGGAAATISVLFNLVVLALWHCDDALRSETTASGAGLLIPGRKAAAVESGRTVLKKGGKKRRYTGLISIQVSDTDRGKRLVEDVLEQHTQLWRIDEIKKKQDGRTTLRYMVRVDKTLAPETVLDAVIARGTPYVLGAALS